jgi:hypothetical protein
LSQNTFSGTVAQRKIGTGAITPLDDPNAIAALFSEVLTESCVFASGVIRFGSVLAVYDGLCDGHRGLQ